MKKNRTKKHPPSISRDTLFKEDSQTIPGLHEAYKQEMKKLELRENRKKQQRKQTSAKS